MTQAYINSWIDKFMVYSCNRILFHKTNKCTIDISMKVNESQKNNAEKEKTDWVVWGENALIYDSIYA